MYEVTNKDIKIPVRKLSWTQIVNIVFKVNYVFCANVVIYSIIEYSNDDLSYISMGM